MDFDIGPHVGEDVLELYLLERLPEPDAATVEEHLFACASCQRQIEHTEEFMLATKAALREIRRKPAARAAHAGASGALLSWFSAPVIATAALGLAIGTSLQSHVVSPAGPAASVRLSATRGAGLASAHVRGSSRFILTLDIFGLPAAGSYDVHVVSAAGVDLWQGRGQSLDDRAVRVEVRKRLAAGQYWIRLYRDGELAREYGLAVD